MKRETKQECKALLRFLATKTAACRAGVKPGELLRVRSCRRCDSSLCLKRKDVLGLLQLEHLELRRDAESSLVLFFNRARLSATLSSPDAVTLLKNIGYSLENGLDGVLEELKTRFSLERIPHEVGLFVGYPAKDVEGFMQSRERRIIPQCDWAIFGDESVSLFLMRIWRAAERLAREIFDTCEDLSSFYGFFSPNSTIEE